VFAHRCAPGAVAGAEFDAAQQHMREIPRNAALDGLRVRDNPFVERIVLAQAERAGPTGSTVVAKSAPERIAGRCAAPVRQKRSLACSGLRRKRGVHEQADFARAACGGSLRNISWVHGLCDYVGPSSRLHPLRTGVGLPC